LSRRFCIPERTAEKENASGADLQKILVENVKRDLTKIAVAKLPEHFVVAGSSTRQKTGIAAKDRKERKKDDQKIRQILGGTCSRLSLQAFAAIPAMCGARSKGRSPTYE
jgi:hypothetical protein